MPRCIKCEREVEQPSERVLRQALRAQEAGKLIHWDCPFCKAKDTVIGVFVPQGITPGTPMPKDHGLNLSDYARDFFHV